jgi:hypothetical protein
MKTGQPAWFRHFEANFSAHENPAALEGSADSNVLSLACARCWNELNQMPEFYEQKTFSKDHGCHSIFSSWLLSLIDQLRSTRSNQPDDSPRAPWWTGLAFPSELGPIERW